MSNNLPQTLEERTQFVLGALLATGITAPWMSAFAASPERFRDFLKAHRRMASLHIHPDVLEGGSADTKALSGLATPYFAAVDALMLMDDAELPNALRLFADRYGTPRAELLDKLQELMSERNAITEKAKRDADDLKRTFDERGKAVTETLRRLSAFYTGHLDGVSPYPLPEGGKTIALPDVAGRFVASPIGEDFESMTPGKTGRHVGYVSPGGVLTAKWLPNAPTELAALAAAATAALFTKTGKPTESADANRGKIVAFTNSETLDDGDVRDTLFARGVMPGEITFPHLPLEKIVNALAGRLRQTEKHNDKAAQTAPGADDYDIRRAVLVAVKPDVLGAGVAPDTFTLTLFPLAALLSVPAKPKE